MSARGHRPRQQAAGDHVELAGVTEPEGPQERADRGRGSDPVPQHRTGAAGTQRVDVLDAVSAGSSQRS